jgi:ribose 5-phosphate isomerase B
MEFRIFIDSFSVAPIDEMASEFGTDGLPCKKIRHKQGKSTDTMSKKIAIACDHAALDIKNQIKAAFADQVSFSDFGTDSTESMDYPDTIGPACQSVAAGENEAAIVLCGTGIGASITANKVKGVRAALVHDDFTTEMSRRHNDSNVLVLGARVLGPDLILRLVAVWLETEFDGGRHARRLDKVHALEQE